MPAAASTAGSKGFIPRNTTTSLTQLSGDLDLSYNGTNGLHSVNMLLSVTNPWEKQIEMQENTCNEPRFKFMMLLGCPSHL